MWEKDLLDLMKAPKGETVTSIIADVVSLKPLKLSFFNSQVYVTGNQIVLTRTLKALLDGKYNVFVGDSTNETELYLSDEDVLKVGDKVVVIPYNDMKKFIVIDKVVNSK